MFGSATTAGAEDARFAEPPKRYRQCQPQKSGERKDSDRRKMREQQPAGGGETGEVADIIPTFGSINMIAGELDH